MPMIDVYASADLFPEGKDRQLGEELTLAVLRAEGVVKPGPFHLNNTAAYIHRMAPSAVQTAATASAVIFSQGIGSGLDIASIVTSLTTAKAGPETNALNRSKTALTAQVSAFGTFNSALATFQATQVLRTFHVRICSFLGWFQER